MSVPRPHWVRSRLRCCDRGTGIQPQRDPAVRYVFVDRGSRLCASWSSNSSGLFAKCTIAIRSSPPEGMAGPTYYFELKGDAGGRCFGIHYRTDVVTMSREIFPVLQNVRVPYAGTRPGVNYYRCWGEFASHYHTTWNVAGWFHSGGACTTTPAAVSCVVSVPAVIEHKSVSTGIIRSSARGVANVGCTGKASVGLTSPGGIALYNGKEHVDSRLSVQRGGSTAVIVVADPSVDVDLLSDIDTTQPRAGVYSGAGVLVASWD